MNQHHPVPSQNMDASSIDAAPQAEHVGRMNNDHTPDEARMNEPLAAPAARHYLAGQKGLAVPKRFPDFSRTPDLFRQTPV
ncbi:hypothetical protein CspHIS471_0211100 [Cutaneotrichosporon sp. HIS471]|nr:hypothetical protein CspHIS471_0211100 [Cutaneotrichosporon sp. HIS471]